ncbi:glycosyl hydrolase family 59 [uncultured Ruminococcus sp.]|uniref:glycosyl hydrolase family 59 n=1 Tax=uncultured Ruminococcus sp. TaxID=165186 RepID=UPI00266D1B1A|nr:glycosyl hydrolase family 59 [uncultured Ruminococcus sp.]
MDFSMKNSKFVNKYFSELMDRSNAAPMEIIADGTQANENPAACYRGFGCVSANNSSRLLLDYKAEHPQAYEEIMRLLFQKNYGACLTHIKLELGADINSSSGTEPATKRSANEPADVTRGAGFQFAADAKAINPDITVDFLRWGEPGWVTHAFTISQENGLSARYRWYKETLDAAYAVYGLKFDYISADQNETDTPDEAWILYLRYRLDHETNAPYDYSKIKIIASDEVGSRNIAEQMVDNSVLRNAVDVIGLHYTTFGDSYTNLLNEAYGKEIWYSEGIAPCNVPELTVQADQSGLIGRNGPIDVANRIINSYYNGKMTMYEFQPAVASYYNGSCYSPKQLIRAWEPWSGHYVLDIGFWMAMHFSRFSQKGWMFINGACYGDGEEDHAITNTTHNFMTLTAPDRSELSMFFTNESEEPRIYNVQIKDMAFQDAALSTVITRGPSGRQSYDANWFQRGKTIRCSKNKHGIFTVKVPPQSIMTVTTLDTSWVNGVNTFSGIQPPSSARLTLPYRDRLEYTKEEICVRGCAPRYMTDQGGAFELIETAEDGYVICQRISRQILPTNWRFRGTPLPLTSFGDDKWHSYSAEVDVRLANLDENNFAGIGVRYNSAVTCEFSSMCGYTGRLYGDGSWKLMDMENVAAEGILSQVNPKEWNHLKLIVLGNSIFFFINGNFLTKYTPQCMINSGRVSLCSDYSWNMFRNIAVEPVRLQPLYVRRIDCFGDNILYNENWEIHAMESYMFYNRTSMEAKAGAEFSCTFEGTGISIIGTAKNAEFTVLIDGHTIYENFFVPSSLPRQACLILDQLPEGVHSMRVFLNHGEFRLDVLEIPEPYSRMTDTLMIPKEVRAEMTEEQQQEQYRRRFVADTMDAEAMLWHMEHPFTQPPEPEETEFPAEQLAAPESEHSDAESTENPVTAESEATESAAETEAALSDSEPASVPEEPAAPTATEESTADADDSAGLPEV